MGATESVMVISQEKSIYNERECLEQFSSDKHENVLRLYKVSADDTHVVCADVDKVSADDTHVVDMTMYVVVLFNPNRKNQCFSLFHTNNREEGEKKFRELCDVLVPFIDIFPSIYSTEMLTAFFKTRQTNPAWSLHKVAEHMQLPEIKDWKNQQQQKEALELMKREQPSFFADLFGTATLQYLTERHPDLLESCMSAVYTLQQTGKDLKDSWGNLTKYTETPIHVAIRCSQEGVLRMLLEKGANPSIPCGHAYPIHLAMQYATMGCAKLLLEYDPNCLSYKDTKYNGSPLHWAKSSEFIDFLVEHGVDVNERNFDGETPLHIMVARKRLSSVISLICYGADVNTKAENGTTPLHYSVQQDDLDIVKALLFLGADPLLTNDQGKTAIQCVEDESEFYSDLIDLFTLFDYPCTEKAFSGERTQSILKEKTGYECLLSLDGGGIRGLILTEVLFALQSVTGHNIYELFDWMCGTSTGSYLTISNALGKSIHYCQRVYFRLGKICFQGARPYPTENMDKFLLEEFGEDTKMNSIQYPNVMIPAVMGDRRPAMLHLFRNYEAPYDDHYQMRDARFPRPPLPSDQLVWLATRSSCSAPSYFRSTGRYLDGGLIANNPTLDVLSEIHKHEKFYNTTQKNNKTNLKVVVSIGTGRQPLQVLRTIDIYRPSSVWDTPEIVDNLKGFVDLMIDQVAASDDHVVDRARSWCEMIDVSYFRFNPILSTEVELNQTNDRILLAMLCDVRKYILKNFELIRKLGKILLGEVSPNDD